MNFNGIFKEELLNYIEYKEKCNQCIYTNKIRMIEFDKYTISINLQKKLFTKELVINFINSHINISGSTKSLYASCMRQFGIYLSRYYDDAYILPYKYFKRNYNFIPYIFSEEEIEKIFNTIKVTYTSFPKKQEQIYLIFKILFSTGMRISEVLNLKRKNIDYKNNTIYIENTKNKTDRLLPISESLIQELYNFDKKYNDKYEYFFERNYHQKYYNDLFYIVFRNIIFKAKIMRTNTGPRVHDIRHTFAVNSFRKAINNNEDINYFLPLLSAYLGHNDIKSTYKYLHLTITIFQKIREKVENIIDLRKEINYEEL